jgi:UDP-2-acetamido-3-amino-2,3-dideoxy-glucuronate N-acetyltransferase
MADHDDIRVHPTAVIERGVQLGAGTSIWDNVHIRYDAVIGEQCIVGEKSYIAYQTRIGHRVKINAMVYICYGVIVEDGVMISAGTVFTNDVFPRATTPDLLELRSSDPDEETRTTRVAAGATIGANCTIGSELRIGRFAMVGMGSVVTRDVGDFHLVVGNPARSIGAVCRCGYPIAKWPPGAPADQTTQCLKCSASYRIEGGLVREADAVPAAVALTANGAPA